MLFEDYMMVSEDERKTIDKPIVFILDGVSSIDKIGQAIEQNSVLKNKDIKLKFVADKDNPESSLEALAIAIAPVLKKIQGLRSVELESPMPARAYISLLSSLINKQSLKHLKIINGKKHFSRENIVTAHSIK